MAVGTGDVEMKENKPGKPAKEKATEKENETEEETTKDPELLTLEGINMFVLAKMFNRQLNAV